MHWSHQNPTTVAKHFSTTNSGSILCHVHVGQIRAFQVLASNRRLGERSIWEAPRMRKFSSCRVVTCFTGGVVLLYPIEAELEHEGQIQLPPFTWTPTIVKLCRILLQSCFVIGCGTTKAIVMGILAPKSNGSLPKLWKNPTKMMRHAKDSTSSHPRSISSNKKSHLKTCHE